MPDRDGMMTMSEITAAWQRDREAYSMLLVRNNVLSAENAEANLRIAELEQENQRLKALLKHIRTITDKQAEDEGLWFAAVTAPEAYLQQELRKLHSAIEALLPENQHE